MPQHMLVPIFAHGSCIYAYRTVPLDPGRVGICIRMAKALKSRPYAVKAGLSRGDGEMRRGRHFEIDDRDGHSVL